MFSWIDFLEFAKELGESDASRRTAISRAYYAAFHTSRDYLVQSHRIPSLVRHRAHAIVWNTFGESDASVDQRIGQMGYRLSRFRQRADYELVYPQLDIDLRIVLRDAEWLIREISGRSSNS
jgi:uncharacterized protein (UPF0332 family)